MGHLVPIWLSCANGAFPSVGYYIPFTYLIVGQLLPVQSSCVIMVKWISKVHVWKSEQLNCEWGNGNITKLKEI